MDITEILKKKTEGEKEARKLNKEFEELIIKLTSNLVSKKILTPIFIDRDIKGRIVITKDGIKKQTSNSRNLKYLEIYEYQDIKWSKLVDWIKNNTKIDSNIFYQIGNAVSNYNIRTEEEIELDKINSDKFLEKYKNEIKNFSIFIGDNYSEVPKDGEGKFLVEYKIVLPEEVIWMHYSKEANNNESENNWTEYKKILPDEIWNQLLDAIYEFNIEVSKQNKLNKEVINNLKKELNYKLVFEET